MNVQPISGYGVKGPACFLVECLGRRFLLDLGEGPEPGRLPDLGSVGRIDAILISHGHKDHIGGLHLAERVGSPPVYATNIVRTLHPDALDAAHDLPLKGSTTICGVPVETGRASHAPGGVWIRVGGDNSVLYTGDWTAESLLYPLDPMPLAQHLIFDAAYGAYDDAILPVLNRIVEAAKTHALLLPMPPDGRGLDVAVALLDQGIVPSLCSRHIQVAKTLVERFPESVAPEGLLRLQRLLNQAQIIDPDIKPTGVLIAADASANGGCSKLIVERYRDNPTLRIIFTGYVPGGSTASELIDAGRAEKLRWNVHPRLRDAKALLETVKPAHIWPAFLSDQELGNYLNLLQR